MTLSDNACLLQAYREADKLQRQASGADGAKLQVIIHTFHFNISCNMPSIIPQLLPIIPRCSYQAEKKVKEAFEQLAKVPQGRYSTRNLIPAP